MPVRIEIGPERVERPDAALSQQVVQLGVNQLDAAPVRIGGAPVVASIERPPPDSNARSAIS